MPKRIEISSYECDCGHQLHFLENTIREMKRLSYRRREGSDRHAAIFYKGEFVAMFCPKAGRQLPVTPSADSARAIWIDQLAVRNEASLQSKQRASMLGSSMQEK